MVDVSYSPDEATAVKDVQALEDIIPEDNVERLRNIRDMFENSTDSDELVLQEVKKLQPSDKIKDRFKKFEDGVIEDDEEEEEEEVEEKEGPNGEKVIISKSRSSKKKEIVPFAELNDVKTKFENIAKDSGIQLDQAPKPMRSITPPLEGANRTEIENVPAQRPANVVSSNELVEDALPSAGYTRARKEMFTFKDEEKPREMPRVKSITPPREEIQKRVLKETTPERNENVVRESDRADDVLPSAGIAKQTAAIFTNSRQKSIERSGISIEGELAEKGIAKSRLALFNDPEAVNAQLNASNISTTELESEIIKNASGIAKERLNLFKNIEASGNRTSPTKEVKKLKEFTPPPQLDHQQRQYIIIDKENNENPDIIKETSHVHEEFVPESGLAKNRMKQYLETASSKATKETDEMLSSGDENAPAKGLAKSLRAKWESMENVKDGKETSENGEDQCLPHAGTAKSLLNKFQNIDASAAPKEKRGPRPITPPPPEELERLRQLKEKEDAESMEQKVEHDDELLKIERGYAKNALAKFEQSVIESTTKTQRRTTPPKEFLSKISSSNVQSVYESNPVESGINAQFAEEEIIPSAGHAKNLKSKFMNFEKEASKVETSSEKMHYVPKKFTSATTPSAMTTKTTTTTTTSTTNGVKKEVGVLTGGDKCCVCGKIAYAMEKIEADNNVYHKQCFKCTSCNCTLNEKDSYYFLNDKPYCMVDYNKFIVKKTPPSSPAKKGGSTTAIASPVSPATTSINLASPKKEAKAAAEPKPSPKKEAALEPKPSPKKQAAAEPKPSPKKEAAAEPKPSPKSPAKPKKA